jgi:hypothetical protein
VSDLVVQHDLWPDQRIRELSEDRRHVSGWDNDVTCGAVRGW